jgi:hypothetical protein
MANNLNPLPASDDKFWEYAEVNKIEMSKSPECEHYFVRTKGTEAECRKCRMGYFLTPEFQVKKGHIYQYDELVI